MAKVSNPHWQQGWIDCLDAVRATLENYPNAGGDIEIMGHVERLLMEENRRVCESVERHLVKLMRTDPSIKLKLEQAMDKHESR
jgi:hypothetical protein